jgi:hypothetical protein
MIRTAKMMYRTIPVAPRGGPGNAIVMGELDFMGTISAENEYRKTFEVFRAGGPGKWRLMNTSWGRVNECGLENQKRSNGERSAKGRMEAPHGGMEEIVRNEDYEGRCTAGRRVGVRPGVNGA